LILRKAKVRSEFIDMASIAKLTVAPPPWKLKATIYTFMLYTSSKMAKQIALDKSLLYSPLEASSEFSKNKFVGGLGMVQVIRYAESPVGPYDEFLLMPGSFEYDSEEQTGGISRTVKQRNSRVTRIYVSQKDTCWNGRTSRLTRTLSETKSDCLDWNIPKHLAGFKFTNLADGAIAIAVYPHDSSPSDSSPSTAPVFSAVYKSIPYLPAFPASTGMAKYIGLDLSIVQPPLPEGEGAQGELPGTTKWCQCLPLEYSSKTSIGWWDLEQGSVGEEDALLEHEGEGPEDSGVGYKNFWPEIGRWRIGMKMEDATIEFPEGKHWESLD
jgi:hypothetical protein